VTHFPAPALDWIYLSTGAHSSSLASYESDRRLRNRRSVTRLQIALPHALRSDWPQPRAIYQRVWAARWPKATAPSTSSSARSGGGESVVTLWSAFSRCIDPIRLCRARGHSGCPHPVVGAISRQDARSRRQVSVETAEAVGNAASVLFSASRLHAGSRSAADPVS
jgi:hypothetical protein